MREFLVLVPLNIVLGSLAVIVVISCWLVSQTLLEFELDGKSLSGWLSPSMVVLEEHIVQVKVVFETRGYLIHMWWDVADLVDDAWSNLSDVHIDEKTVVGVDLSELVFGQVSGVEVVLDIAVLVWKDDVWMSELVSWGFEIVDLEVL